MTAFPVPSPSDLPSLPPGWPVAVDCETGHLNKGGSGLWADSGARLSIVSVAWIPPEIVRHPDPQVLRECVKTGRGVESRAFPFAQGKQFGPGPDAPYKPNQQPDLFTSDDNPNLTPEDYAALMRWLEPHRHVYHNGKFDLEKLRFLPLGWGEPAPSGPGPGPRDFLAQTFWDTQVCCPVFWPRETSSLKPTSARLWAGEDETAEADALKPFLGPKTDPGYDLVPWDVIGPYAAKDAHLTIRLAYHQWALLGRWFADHRDWVLDDRCVREIEVMKSLYRMERAGIPFDVEESRRAAAVLSSRISDLERRLPFRPTDAQAKQFFFSDRPVKKAGQPDTPSLGLLPYATTDTGAPSLTAEVVGRLVRDYPETSQAGAAARIWAERAKLDTAVSMWYLPYADGIGADGRLRTCFRQVTRGRGTVDGGTRSGRFSVERVNLQAIPHDYRLDADAWGVPTPRGLIGSAAARIPGWQQWEFDLAQAELRVAAAWAKCTPMLEAISQGRDLHSETTMSLWKDQHPGDPQWGFYRQLGKRGNFTLCFGAGGDTFAKMVSKETGVILSSDESSAIVERWNGLYPQFRRAISRWSDYVQQHRAVPLASRAGFATGRERVFAWGEEDHKAFNQLVQGSLAEFLKDWLLAVQAICDSEQLGFVEGVGWTGLLLTIHDSLVLLLPDDRAEAIAARVVSAAESLWHDYFGSPDPAGRVAHIDGTAEGKRWG